MATFSVVRRIVLRSAIAFCLLASGWSISGALAGVSMATGGITSQPIGHYDFCKRRPAECSIRPTDLKPLHMTRKLWDEIVGINLSVNHRVQPVSDMDHYGVIQYWNYPDDNKGNCEHYALEKRRELMRKGISLADLLMTVVRLPDGEGHAIVTVRTDKGDFILDNLTDDVKNWTKTPYHYLKRQASDNTGHWVTIYQDEGLLAGLAN